MAGDIVISDKFTHQDVRHLEAFGIDVTVKLDLTHPRGEKPPHLEIELDFNKTDAAGFDAMMSQLKQKFGSTHRKLQVKKFDPRKKNYTGKYEVPAFGRSILKNAKNARKLKEAFDDYKAGKKMGMLLVKF